MNDSFMDRFMPMVGESPTRPDDDSGEPDDYTSFGWLRGTRDRAMMLELRFRNGNIESHSYLMLERACYDPSIGIRLHFGSRMVQIIGKNLNSKMNAGATLFSGILRHRVAWIAECSLGDGSQLGEGATFVEEIRNNAR